MNSTQRGISWIVEYEDCIPAMTDMEIMLVLNGLWYPDHEDLMRWMTIVAHRREEIRERIRQSLER